MQIKTEILGLLDILQVNTPTTLLEIGTARGGTLYLFSRIAPRDARIISVDLPGGAFGGGYPHWKARLFKSFTKGRQAITLIRGSSRTVEVSKQVKDSLDGRLLDFLFIDGDHSYAGVRGDFEIYGPFVRPGGIVAFHDIRPGDPKLVGDVPRFWSEIRTRYETREILSSSGTGFGIGVVIL